MAPTAGSTSSTEPPTTPGAPETWVAVGRIAGAHGLRGCVRVRLFDGVADTADTWTHVRIGRGEEDAAARRYEVASLEPGRAGEVRMQVQGVSTREAAEALRGRLVMVDARRFAELPEGEYYGYQLVGCRVVSSEGAELGTVRDIWSTGAPDVLVVEDGAGRQQLIPAAEELLREVDLERRRIVVELVPGLLEEAPEPG